MFFSTSFYFILEMNFNYQMRLSIWHTKQKKIVSVERKRNIGFSW